MSTLPIFGPTEVQNVDDDLGPAVAIVRVDFALSREELQTALAYGYASANQDCPVEDMSVQDVRREVEGHLAFAGYVKLTRHVESERVRSDKDPVRDAAFAAALDRAYPPVVPAPAPSGPDRVLLQAVLEALDIPHAATVGDGEVHDRILLDRVMDARVALEGVLRRGDDPGWSADYLRAHGGMEGGLRLGAAFFAYEIKSDIVLTCQ